MTAMEGDKFVNGIICGLGELLSCFFTGIFMRYFMDKFVSLAMTFVCVLFYILFLMSDPTNGGIIVTFFLLMAVFGVGGIVNVNYCLMEARMPPER